MRILKLIVVAVCMILPAAGFAQQDWSVNPADYQYTMTITGVARFYCQESVNENDKVAAFVGDVCRGVQGFTTDANGRKLAYLTVYSNSAANEEVTFKLYKEDQDTILNTVFPVVFENNASLGNSELPYVFKSDYELKTLSLSNTIVYDYDSAGVAVSVIVATNEIDNTVAANFELVNTGNDNGYFSIKGDSLYLTTNANFAQKKFYDIEVRGYTKDSCSISSSFHLEVINTNEAPTGLVNAYFTIDENKDAKSQIAELAALDPTKIDSHTFEITGPVEEWPDREFFSIEGNKLFSTASFDYETKATYTFQVIITDAVGNNFTEVVTVAIQDVVETGSKLPASNFLSPNNDGFNDAWEIENVELYKDYSLIIFSASGQIVYKATNYQNDWQGTYNGTKLPTGAYYYLLQHTSKDISFKGSITLVNE